MDYTNRARSKARLRERMTRRSHARNRQIEAGPAPDYPPVLPELRRRVVVTDYDFGARELVVSLYKSPRVDCYMVEIGGEIVDDRAGWSTVLEEIRKRFPRLRSSY